MKRKRNNLFLIVAVAAMALVMVALLPRQILADKARGNKIIFMGDSNYAPYEFLKDATPTGANVDLLKAIGKALGRPIEIRLMSWSEAQAQVLAGREHNISGIRAALPPFARKIASIVAHKWNPDLQVIDKRSGKKVILLKMEHLWLFIGLGGLAATALVLLGILLHVSRSKRVRLQKEIETRKRVEEEIKRLSRRSQLILDASGDGIYGLDKEGNFTFINSAAAEMIGWRPEDLIGKFQHDILHHTKPDGSPYPHEECPIYAAFKDGQVHHVTDEVFWRKDGTSFPVEYVSTPIRKENKVIGAVVVFRNITERKSTEKALRESERRLRSVTDSTSEAIIAADIEGNIISWNKGASIIFGYSEEEVLGKRLKMLIPEKNRERHKAGLKRIRETGETRLIGKTMELSGIRKSGEEFPLELTLGMWEAGGETFFSGIIRDTSERKKTEAQLRQAQKMESIGSLAGGIAHDLNNMLLPILTLSGMTVKNLPVDSDDRQRLEKVVQAAERAKDLVARILVFSRQEEDAKQANVDIYSVVREAMGILRSTIPSTIEIKERLDKKTGTVFADAGQVQTLLMNLASNAADAMGGKIGRMDISLKRTEITAKRAGEVHGLKPGTWARLTVKDSGCGMDEKTLGRIYDPFFTTKGVGEGTGLGLSMVHGFVRHHGGIIDVSSKPGKGTTFDVYLPLVKGGK